MKTLKIILAWLDWSSYSASDSYYEKPKTLCPLFWRTFFTIITSPLTYIAHVVNIFSPWNFRNGFVPTIKLHMGSASLLHVVMIGVGFAVLRGLEKDKGWDLIRRSEPLWSAYLKIVITGILVIVVSILALAAIIGACYGIWWIGKLFYDKYQDSKPEALEEQEPGFIKSAYRAIKDKYCPIIDWSDVEKS